MNITEITLEFAASLKRNMQRNHLGAMMLSKKTGINKSLIYKYLRGEVYPSVDNMSLLLTVLNCDLKSFYN